MDQYTDGEWEWLIAEAMSAAWRRNPSETMSWHRAFAIGLLEAIERFQPKERPSE